MNVFSRGVRNAFRNSIRTASLVLILGLSIGLALAMLVARSAVTDKIESVKSSIGNTISVSPAGIRGFEGGGSLLSATNANDIKNMDHVSGVVTLLNDRLTTTTTNLQSAIEAGSFGQRRANDSGTQIQVAPPEGAGPSFSTTDGTGTVTRTFTPPVMVTGTNTTDQKSVFGGDAATITSGALFDATSDQNVAAVGSAIATKNNLTVGSTFTMYGTDVKVVAIFDTGNTFGNGGVVMPIKAVQKLSSQADQVSSITVTTDSIENIDSVVSAIKAKLGDTADVVSNKDTAATAVEPLQNIQKISLYSLLGAVVAGAVIILLTMVMIVRERRREVGVLKAIGASNLKVVLQFMSEAVTLTLLGAVVGVVIGFATSAPVTKALVTSSTSSSSTSQQFGPGQGGPRGGFARVSTRGLNISNVKTTVGWDILGYGFVAAIVIAVVGSAVPAWLITKVRPAEVMRAE